MSSEIKLMCKHKLGVPGSQMITFYLCAIWPPVQKFHNLFPIYYILLSCSNRLKPINSSRVLESRALLSCPLEILKSDSQEENTISMEVALYCVKNFTWL